MAETGKENIDLRKEFASLRKALILRLGSIIIVGFVIMGLLIKL